jgi:hypothetical protein
MDNRIMNFDEFIAQSQPQVDEVPQAQPEMQPEMPIEPAEPMAEPQMEPAMEPNMEQPAPEPGQDAEGLQMLEEPAI